MIIKLIVKLKIYILYVLFFIIQLSINDPAVRPWGWDEIYSKYILKPHTNIVWWLNTSLLSILMFSRTPETHVSVYSSTLSHFLIVIIYAYIYCYFSYILDIGNRIWGKKHFCTWNFYCCFAFLYSFRTDGEKRRLLKHVPEEIDFSNFWGFHSWDFVKVFANARC